MATTNEHTAVLGGITYTTTTLTASDGLRIMPRLVALLGREIMGLLFASDDADRATLFQDPKILGLVVSSIAENAAEDDGFLIIRDLLKTTEADKIQIGQAEVPGSVFTHFDTHFRGRYAHLMEVAMWVGKVNFFGP